MTNKFIIAKYIDENKDDIIRRYANNMSISEIAETYEVATTTIYLRLIKWGIKIRRHIGPRRRKNEKPKKQKTNFSPELQAQLKRNSQINNKYIKNIASLNRPLRTRD